MVQILITDWKPIMYTQKQWYHFSSEKQHVEWMFHILCKSVWVSSNSIWNFVLFHLHCCLVNTERISFTYSTCAVAWIVQSNGLHSVKRYRLSKVFRTNINNIMRWNRKWKKTFSRQIISLNWNSDQTKQSNKFIFPLHLIDLAL